jgi:eukaryotic-like serine/threonine-protein kinase
MPKHEMPCHEAVGWSRNGETRPWRGHGTFADGSCVLGPDLESNPLEKPGVVLAGKYRLSQRIAAGSMGSVWRAEHLALASPVAIKFMRAPSEADSDVRWRFLQEARIAVALRSAHIVQVLDYAVNGATPYIVMELLDGESLAARLARLGRLGALETSQILGQLAHALTHTHHRGVVHRDLKPENIFIVEEGGQQTIKLLDFGVAKIEGRQLGSQDSRDTQSVDIVGTPQYMSPEQLRGAPSVDHRADVWALGVIAFECLMGRPPFLVEDFAGLASQICAGPLPRPSRFGPVPRGFDAWFTRACARDPAHRFSSVRLATSELQLCCAPSMRGRPGYVVLHLAIAACTVVTLLTSGPARLETSMAIRTSALELWYRLVPHTGTPDQARHSR